MEYGACDYINEPLESLKVNSKIDSSNGTEDGPAYTVGRNKFRIFDLLKMMNASKSLAVISYKGDYYIESILKDIVRKISQQVDISDE